MRLTINIIVFVLFLIATPLFAQTYDYPNYYKQSDFLIGSPVSSGYAAGAYFNPAVWGMQRGHELQFYMSDLTKDDPEPKNIAVILGGRGLGFGVQEWRFNDSFNPAIEHKLTDYQIGIGFGDDAFAMGFGYSWSSGYIAPSDPRDNTFAFGMIARPDPRLSFGYAFHSPLNNEDDLRSILDFGVRPFGTPMVTLFGDATMWSREKFEDIEWGAGVMVEPISGIGVHAKAMHGGVYMAGISFSTSRASVSATPRFNKDNDLSYTTYGIRIGIPQKGLPEVTPKPMRNHHYVKMNFDNSIKYQRYLLFDTKGYTLMELLDDLELVKNDPMVGGIQLVITEDMNASYEVIWEVREKIKEVQAAGKKVVVYLERGDVHQYYMASVADKIMLDPSGMIFMPGFVMGRSYYKDGLEKLGVGFDEWRFFKYKSAMEGLSRDSMSDADRQQRLEIAEGFYNVLRDDVCESRGITHEQFDYCINNIGVLDADSMLAYNLVDTLGRKDGLKDIIESLEGKAKPTVGMAMLKMNKPVSRQWGIQPKVAVIYALGPCAMNSGINARRLEGTIKAARENKHVKAVVLRADSPGGDILPSDIVALELKKTAEEKPVIISQGQVAASGGYWISMYGDDILASPWTITGSIGVIGGWFYNDGFYDRFGMDFDHTKVGDHADLGRGAQLPILGLGIPARNLTAGERQFMETTIKGWYDDFLVKVAEGRNMEKDAVHEVAQGRVWTGTAGLNNGLIDKIGGLEDAIELATERADLKKWEELTVIEAPNKGLFDPSMFAPKLLGIHLPGWMMGEESYSDTYYRMLMEANGQPMVLTPPEYILE